MHPVTLHLVSINIKQTSTRPVFEKDIATHLEIFSFEAPHRAPFL